MIVRRVVVVVVFTLLLFCCSCRENIQNWDKTRPYLYEDTKRLVTLVEDAAELMEKQGTAAFTEFGTRGSRMRHTSLSTILTVPAYFTR